MLFELICKTFRRRAFNAILFLIVLVKTVERSEVLRISPVVFANAAKKAANKSVLKLKVAVPAPVSNMNSSRVGHPRLP